MDRKTIISLAGSIIAVSIGTGFATGQEILQFFSSYGVIRCVGAVIITMFLFVWLCATVLEDGRRLKIPVANEIWTVYCGKWLGTALKYYTPVNAFLIVLVMVAGAGATFEEYYGLPGLIGRVGIAVTAWVIVSLGMNKIARFTSVLGVLIIAFSLSIGLVSLCRNFGGLREADQILMNAPVMKAASNWAFSGVLYTTFMALGLIPFLVGLSFQCGEKRTARMGGIVGGLLFCVCLLTMALAILASMGAIQGSSVPTLVIASRLHPALGLVFSVILMLGMISPTVSMTWIICNFIDRDEKSPRFRITALIILTGAVLASRLPFARLVNIFYPYTGRLGILICLCVAFHRFLDRRPAGRRLAVK